MSLREILEESPNLTVDGLQRFQREYDQRFISDQFSGFNKIRHTYAHMGKLLGRLAEYVQMIEDGTSNVSPDDLKHKVIPDLLVYAGWLAEELGVTMEEVYLTRMVGNIRRLHSERISPEELHGLETYVRERFKKTE